MIIRIQDFVISLLSRFKVIKEGQSKVYFILLWVFFLFFFERERERNIDQLLPTLSRCPDQEPNPSPFGTWDDAPTH